MHINTETTNATGIASRYSLTVIGSGPIGVHVLARAVSEGLVSAEDAVIVDPHPEPFAQWHQRVRNCRMGFLRSPASHGISRDFRTIRRAIENPHDFTPPYHRPSVELFAEHLKYHGRDAIAGVHYIQGEARVIRSVEREPGYRVEIATNSSNMTIETDRIILSVGQPTPYLPPTLRDVPSAAGVFHVHNDSGKLDALNPASDVALVGGGIAAAHLAVALSTSGHSVTVWNRDRFTSHQFDSDPCFVGPRCGALFSSIGDYRRRRTLIQRTRRPGSVPPELFRQLRSL